MSYTEIFGFHADGLAYRLAEIQNSWRGGVAVWGALEKNHLSPFIPRYAKTSSWYRPEMSYEDVSRFMGYAPTRVAAMFENDAMREIWGLVENDKVPVSERICLCTTFDKVIVEKKHLQRVIDAFRSFPAETSLGEQADTLEKALADPDCIAVAWNQTSVNCDSWVSYRYIEETDTCEPYNLLEDSEHWSLFSEYPELLQD